MQHFWYCIKRTLRSRMGMFWILIFPILLGTLFYVAFNNIGNEEQFSEVGVGIIVEEENDSFVSMLKEVKVNEELNMFEVTEYDTKQEAEDALNEETIRGYIIVNGDEFSMVVKQMDSYSSLIKSFLDQYKQNYVLIESVAEEHPEQVGVLVEELSSGEGIGLTEIPLKGQDKSPYTQYFYALLAMACLMGSMSGLGMGVELQADLSNVGIRRNVAPMKKMKQVIIEFLATFSLFCVLMSIIMCYLVYVLNQDFGDNMGLILLGTWAGSFAGIAVGITIAVFCKGTQEKKEGLCTVFFMGSSFFSGLFMHEMPRIIEQNCPIINRMNPASLIANGFQSLAVFGDYEQYAVNLITLFIIGAVLIVLSAMKLRRTKYASL